MRYQILSSQLFSVIGFFFQFSWDIKPQHLCRLHFRSKLNPFWNGAHIFQQAPFNTQLPWCNSALSILSIRLCGVESVWYEDPQFSLLLRKVKKSPRQRAAAHFINVSAQPEKQDGGTSCWRSSQPVRFWEKPNLQGKNKKSPPQRHRQTRFWGKTAIKFDWGAERHQYDEVRRHRSTLTQFNTKRRGVNKRRLQTAPRQSKCLGGRSDFSDFFIAKWKQTTQPSRKLTVSHLSKRLQLLFPHILQRRWTAAAALGFRGWEPTLMGLLRASWISNLLRMMVWSSFLSNASRSM